MPNRVVRADILESDKVNKLSWAGEVFYRRLMSILDDYGFGDGRIAILRSKLYPLRLDKVSESDITKWLAECESAGLVRLYQVSDRPYLEMFNFGQTLRQKKAKFPTCEQMQADASTCEQMSPERKGNETERKVPPFDPSDYYNNPEEAFEDIKNNEVQMENLLRLVKSYGYATTSKVTVMLAAKKFLSIEGAKDGFTSRTKKDVKDHFINWINKNGSKLHE
jgi:hypothetical protein